MKRYLSDADYEAFLADFGFLFNLIRDSKGEYDLRLRDGYFNVYYQGNSMMKVEPHGREYRISMHEKFACKVFGDPRFDTIRDSLKNTDGYNSYSVPKELLHPFLQKTSLVKVASNIRAVGYGEEIVFQDLLVTDNMECEDYCIVDREVTDTALSRKRIDLLALRQRKGNQYSLEVVEVKLGKNPELQGEVAGQLERYVNHIDGHFDDWKESYQKTYSQMKRMGLFREPKYEEVEIVRPVTGKVVVFGYSGIASGYLDKLRSDYPNMEVQQFKHDLHKQEGGQF